MKKLAVIIFDALGIDMCRGYDLYNIQHMYMNKNSSILTCSSYPHTQTSNIMIWSGKKRNWFWVRNNSNEWLDPAWKFNRIPDPHGAHIKDEDVELIKPSELDWPFIWNILDDNGYKARALQLPLALPPISFNAVEETKDWFPYWEEGTKNNLRDKERITMDSLKEMSEGNLDFYCTSFPQPDKLLHGVAEGHFDRDFLVSELHYMDKVARRIMDYCDKNNITCLMFGDHGPPGADPNFGKFYDEKIVVVRHRKHSCIISNYDGDIPTYTDEIFPWMLKYFDIDK